MTARPARITPSPSSARRHHDALGSATSSFKPPRSASQEVQDACRKATERFEAQGHDLALWEGRDDPSYGEFATQCTQCGESIRVARWDREKFAGSKTAASGFTTDAVSIWDAIESKAPRSKFFADRVIGMLRHVMGVGTERTVGLRLVRVASTFPLSGSVIVDREDGQRWRLVLDGKTWRTKRMDSASYEMSHRPSDDGPPANNLLQTGAEWEAPPDIYEHPGRYLGTRGQAEKETVAAVVRARGASTVTVYRASPVGEINPGDWVSLSRSYAAGESMSEGTPVWSATVPAEHVRWAGDDLHEWGYFGPSVSSVVKVSSKGEGHSSLVDLAIESNTADAFALIHNVARGHDEIGSINDALDLDSVTMAQVTAASAEIARRSQAALAKDGFSDEFSVWRSEGERMGSGRAGVVPVTLSAEVAGHYRGVTTEYKVRRSDVLTYARGLNRYDSYAGDGELHVDRTALRQVKGVGHESSRQPSGGSGRLRSLCDDGDGGDGGDSGGRGVPQPRQGHRARVDGAARELTTTASTNTLYRGMLLRGINKDDELIEAMRSNSLDAFVQRTVRDTVAKAVVSEWSMRSGDKGQGVGVHWTTDKSIAKSFSISRAGQFTVAMFDSWLSLVIEATYTPGSEVDNPEENTHAYRRNGKDEKEVPLRPGSPLTLVRAQVLVPSNIAKFVADYDEEGEAQTRSVKWITVPLGISAVAAKDGDTRDFGRFQMRYHTEDQGERKPRHVIRTFDGATEVGVLNWYGTTGTVHHIGVEDGYLRQGIATAMWEWGQEMRPAPKHSGDRTTQGDAWAKSVGGPRPRTASANTIYRGYKIDFPNDMAEHIRRLTAPPMEENQIDQHFKLGPIILDFLSTGNWERQRGWDAVGLGRHWTTRKEMAETAAYQGAARGYGLLLEATYEADAVSETLVHTTPGYAQAENEINLRSGGKVTVVGVYLTDTQGWPKDWNLLTRPVRTTASRWTTLDPAALSALFPKSPPLPSGWSIQEDEEGEVRLTQPSANAYGPTMTQAEAVVMGWIGPYYHGTTSDNAKNIRQRGFREQRYPSWELTGFGNVEELVKSESMWVWATESPSNGYGDGEVMVYFRPGRFHAQPGLFSGEPAFVADSYADAAAISDYRKSKTAGKLSQESLISVAENVMENFGLVGRTFHQIEGHVDDPAYQASMQPLRDYVMGVVGGWVNVHVSNYMLDKNGAQAMLTGTGTMYVRESTSEMTVLHECAHLIARTDHSAQGHDDRFVSVLRDLYGKHLGSKALAKFDDIYGAIEHTGATRPANDYEQGPFRKVVAWEPDLPTHSGRERLRERLECGHEGEYVYADEHEKALRDQAEFGRCHQGTRAEDEASMLEVLGGAG